MYTHTTPLLIGVIGLNRVSCIYHKQPIVADTGSETYRKSKTDEYIST